MLDIYLSAVSGIIQSIVDPLGAVLATFIATANVDPPDTPVIIPSFEASSLDQ